MVTRTAADQIIGDGGESLGAARRKRPSRRLVAMLIVVVAPILYVLSYAPTVRFLGRTRECFVAPPDVFNYSANATMIGHAECAEASLYPAYWPVDLLIDNIRPLRAPLFLWAELWGVRDAFENGRTFRASGVLWHELED